MLRNTYGVGDVKYSGKKRYEGGVRFNVISVTRVQFPEKKHYITLEWLLSVHLPIFGGGGTYRNHGVPDLRYNTK